jgi:hypothetical protein
MALDRKEEAQALITKQSLFENWAQDEASALPRTNLAAVTQCRDGEESWTKRRNWNLQLFEKIDDKYITKNWETTNSAAKSSFTLLSVEEGAAKSMHSSNDPKIMNCSISNAETQISLRVL